MSVRSFSPALACVLVVAAGCEVVTPNNPFDPATPADAQAPATLFGRVELARAFDDDDDRVALRVIGPGGVALDVDGGVVSTRIDSESPPPGLEGAAGGTFSVEVPPGAWSIAFDAADNGAFDVGDVVVGPVSVTAGASVRIDVRPPALEPSGRVAGRVIAIAGQTTVARLASIPRGREEIVVVSGDGAFAFDAVAPGSYRVEVTSDGALPIASAPLSVELQPVEVPILAPTALADVVSLGSGVVVDGQRLIDDDSVDVVVDDGGVVDGSLFVRAGLQELPAALRPVQGPVAVDLRGSPDGALVARVQLALCYGDRCECDVDVDADGCAAFEPPLLGSVVELPFVVDTTAPTLGALACVDCTILDGVAWSPSLTATIAADADDQNGVSALEVTQCPAGVCAVSLLPAGAPLVLVLEDRNDVQQAQVTAVDALGHRSAARSLDLVVDRLAPVVGALINGGAVATSSALVQIEIDASLDVGSPLVAVRASSLGAIEAEAFVPFSSSFAHVLGNGSVDGERTLVLEVKDAAGNVTRVDPAPRITLDRARPTLRPLVLADGSGFTQTATITAVTTSSDTDAGALIVELSGDLDGGPVRLALASLPTALLLTAGEGTKTVNALAVDDAGNASAPVSATIVVDATPPLQGSVRLAGGQAVVQSQAVAVEIRDTLADEMIFFEVPVAETCAAPACGDAAYVPFSPATSVTLAGVEGEHRVCWRFCDAAGNGSDVDSDVVTLGTFIDRPRPTLAAVSPTSLVALSNESGAAPRYPLVVSGRGLATDTQAVVGDFSLSCVPVLAQPCRADDVDGTCAVSCVVELPDEVVRNAGTYVVRLFTPSPVAGGLGTSEATRTLSVVSPLPVLELVEPRGVVQDVDAEGQPVAQVVDVVIRARGLMDNAQVRLAGNFGEVVAFSRDPLDPALVDLVARVSTANIFPNDNVDVDLALVNPSPGGGETATDFGITPRATACPTNEPCLSDLRRTRPLTPDGRARTQAYFFDGASKGGVAVNGADAVTLRDSEGRPLARVLGDGALPAMPLGDLAAVALEDRRRRGPNVSLRAASARAGSTFTDVAAGAGVLSPLSRTMAVVELDPLGSTPDVILVNTASDDISLFVDGVVRIDYPMGGGPAAIATGDVDSDGALDVVVANGGSNELSLRLGDGTGELLARIGIAAGTGQSPRALVNPTALDLADIDGDDDLDLVAAGDSFVVVRRGLGDGRFTTEQLIAINLPGTKTLALVDLDGDGLRDVLVSNGAALFLRNTGGGSFAAPVAAGSVGTSLQLADVNNDGILDAVGIVNFNTLQCSVGDGDGGFTPRGSAPGQGVVGVVDVTGDGFADVVTANNFGIGFLAGDGACGLATRVIVAVTSTPLLGGALADATGDGVVDVVGLHFVPPQNIATQILIHEGGGGPTLGATVIDEFPGGFFGGDLADFNRDGLVDVVTGDTQDIVRVSFGRGDGSYASTTTIDLGAGNNTLGVLSGDFNGDGLPDILASDRGRNRVTLLVGAGTGSFAAPVDVATIVEGNSLVLGDFDVDGRQDALVAANSGVFVVRGRGTGAFDPPVSVRGGSGQAQWGDFNSDGNLDVVVPLGAQVELRTGDGAGAFGGAVDLCAGGRCAVVGGNIFSVATVDLNQDGQLDVVVNGSTAGQGLALLGDGRGGFTPSISTAGQVLGAGDLDGDGDQDLVETDFNRGLNGIEPGRSGGTLGPLIPLGITAFGFIGADVDVNRDGSADLIQLGAQAELRTELSPSGAASLQEHTNLQAASTSLPPGVSDFVISMGPQRVDRLAARLRIVGSGLGAVTATLTAPSGDAVILDDGSAFASLPVWQASYPTTTPLEDLRALQGPQPAGDWILSVDNDGGAVAFLEDFALITVGSMIQLPLGSAPDRPVQLALPSGATGAAVFGTTLSRRNNATPSCVSSTSPDAWYELTVPQTNTASTILLTAGFDAVVELSRGRCAARAPVACNDNAVGRNPQLTNVALTAGTHCIHIDGVGANSAGRFQLTVKLQSAVP